MKKQEDIITYSEYRDINHSFRTPLSNILGMVNIFEKDNLNTTQLEYLKNIEVCSNELLGTLDNFMQRLLSQTTSPSNTSKKILLVEDGPMLQQIATIMLKKSGYQVEVAEDGKQAIEMLSNDYDFILMDLRMPEMDGFEATRAIRQLNSEKRDIPIIALSAEGSDIEAQCLAVGMNAFMSKPLNIEALNALVNNLGATSYSSTMI